MFSDPFSTTIIIKSTLEFKKQALRFEHGIVYLPALLVGDFDRLMTQESRDGHEGSSGSCTSKITYIEVRRQEWIMLERKR